MAVAVVLACVCCLVAAAACALLYVNSGLLAEVRDELRVLKMTVYGLEAAALPEIKDARESADAAVAVVSELKKAVDEVVMSPKARATQRSPFDGANPFGRAMAARELFAQAEATSLKEVNDRG